MTPWGHNDLADDLDGLPPEPGSVDDLQRYGSDAPEPPPLVIDTDEPGCWDALLDEAMRAETDGERERRWKDEGRCRG